jgi:hypothetical protein
VEKVATFMVFGWFLLESAEDRFLGVNPQDSLCHHVLVWDGLLYN